MDRFLFLFFLLFFSGRIFAEDFYWTNTFTEEHFSSPRAACDSFVQLSDANAAKTYLHHATRLYAVRIDPGQAAAVCDVYYAYQYNDNVWAAQYADYPASWTYTGPFVMRHGNGCTDGEYDTSIGQCKPKTPSDSECKTRDPFDVRIQFSMTPDGVVFSADPQIKDHCVFEPGEPKGCTDTYCDVPYTPAGNDDMSDNSDNPEQDMQDYLDELAKKFDCQKTSNGTVGCSNSQTTPPDIDPDNKCPNGYSWSGTACFPTPGGPADRDNSGPTPCTSNCGGTGGNTGGGDTGGGNTGGGDTGGGDTGGGNTGGGGDDDGDGSVTGTACDQIFKCTGDAVNCAIAEKQRASYCEAHELADSEKGFGKIRSELGDEKYSLADGGEVDVSTMFGQGTRFLPASCPGRQAVSLHIGPISFDWQPVCTFAEAMGKIGVALASLFFAVYVGRAFGGE